LKISVKNKRLLGKLLKDQRTKDNQSLRGLAFACEMSYGTLNDIENGNGFPTDEVLLRIVENLNFGDKTQVYDTYAEIKGTAPPDVISYLSKNKSAVELIRKMMKESKGYQIWLLQKSH